MRYTLLIYEDQTAFASRTSDGADYQAAWRAYHHALVEAGVYVTGAPLKDPATATLVHSRDGRRAVQDGPFAEAKEQLGGFVMLELPSLDEALSWAARCPAAGYGTVEVRPVDERFHDEVCD